MSKQTAQLLCRTFNHVAEGALLDSSPQLGGPQAWTDQSWGGGGRNHRSLSVDCNHLLLANPKIYHDLNLLLFCIMLFGRVRQAGGGSGWVGGRLM